jgi:hypothetical protein
MAYHKVANRRVHNHAVEALRRALPLNTYLTILHQGATMGALPVMDEHGNATGEFTEMRPADRLDTLRFLVNKVMPDLKTNEALPAPEDDDLLDQDRLAGMTTDELVTSIRATSPAKAPVDAMYTA